MADIAERAQSTSIEGPRRVRWTRAQADAIVDAGILTGRHELIDGEILDKMGQNGRHALLVGTLMNWLAFVFGIAHLRIQLPIYVASTDNQYNEPEPDLAVTSNGYAAYPDHPHPGDLVLVVEIADSSLDFDLKTKALLYARAGIREYWVVDAAGRTITVHRAPAQAGYASTTAYTETENIAPLARPDATVRIGDLLPQ